MSRGLGGSLSFFKIMPVVVAVVPGWVVLKEQLPLPPGMSVPLAGVLVEISSCVVVGYAWINKKRYQKFSQEKFNRLILLAFAMFALFIVGYSVLQSAATIDSQVWGKKLFVPLFADLSPIKEHSLQKYFDEYGPADLINLLETRYKVEVLATKTAVYALFCLTFMALTGMFTLLWLNQEAGVARRRTTVRNS